MYDIYTYIYIYTLYRQHRRIPDTLIWTPTTYSHVDSTRTWYPWILPERRQRWQNWWGNGMTSLLWSKNWASIHKAGPRRAKQRGPWHHSKLQIILMMFNVYIVQWWRPLLTLLITRLSWRIKSCFWIFARLVWDAPWDTEHDERLNQLYHFTSWIFFLAIPWMYYVILLQTFDDFLIVVLDDTQCYIVFVSHDQEKWLWAHAIVLTRALPFGNETWCHRVIKASIAVIHARWLGLHSNPIALSFPFRNRTWGPDLCGKRW